MSPSLPPREVSHVPVLVEEAVAGLRVREDGTYVDGTFGRGGHSAAILARLGVRGRLLALDQDPEAHSHRALEDPRLELIHARFSTMKAALAARNIDRVAGVLLDLGVSSPQLDTAARGFSFMRDGPLDMRMDTTRGETAAEWIARAEEQEIREVIWRYGEERFAKSVAGAIVAARQLEPILTTGQLAAVVGRAVRTREPGQNPATRTFQALRIFINQELEELEVTLPQAVDVLEPGGRLAVISFHSLEDRIVKNFLRDQATADKLPKNVPVRAKDIPPAPIHLVGKAVKPGDAEVHRNPRSRSAVLRVAEKNEG
ncbi:16S rRNA (cytosine(1402)-N(4))-methyltransferase [Betaproteobacteria bacterium GR16-43]|nr:16S rRNA (cytosine(1402)-N(4))-methyltransferase [Betaproteobacteria bacterium GR16-43]